MRNDAQCVIIGGGAMGVGLLYHLAHEGWTDTLLIEKGELTSGSTWHAAGLVPNFIGSLNMAKVHAYGIDLYKALEAETGMSTGWHGCGAIRLAVTQDQADWYRYVQGVLGSLGVESHLISPDEVRQRVPLMGSTDDIILGFWTPDDGWSDPTGSTNAMAVGARQLGAEIARHTLVTAVDQLPDGRWKVITDKGEVTCDHVVNAAGHYSPQLGAMSGIDVPIVSMIHQYLITEPLDAMKACEVEMPVIRDPRSSCYYRREIDSLLIGPYETRNSITYGLDGIDWNLHFHLTPPDLEQLAPWLEISAERFPIFAEAGIKQVVSGPITHTPDGGYLMGPAPGVRNYWMCAGASIGITQGPGAGKFLAQWMVHGQTEINVREMDPRRFGPWSDVDYTIAKSVDEYHEMYQVRMPGEYRSAGRPLKRTPIAERLDALGAQWQDVWGWERPRYYGEPEDYSWRRSNAHDIVAAECTGVRERVGIADLTAFAKFEVTGTDAAALLGRLSANRLPTRDGGTRLVHMLTDLGGIECEMTVTRLADDRFYLNSAIAGTTHDHDWLVQHVLPGEDVSVADCTDGTAILAVTGPRARDVLAPLTDADLSNGVFPWLTGQEITIAGVPCIALRVSYVGELGWELHHELIYQRQIYQQIVEAGREFGLANCGMRAVLGSMRLEKGYVLAPDICGEETPLQAGLEFFVKFDKGDFIGRAALEEQKTCGVPTRLVTLVVEAGDADACGEESIWNGDDMVGRVTSGGWGHRVGASLALGYIDSELSEPGTRVAVEILDEKRLATVVRTPHYDPENTKVRA